MVREGHFDISTFAEVSPLARSNQIFTALASSTRCRLICRLLDGAYSVGTLAEALQLGQSNISNHLALLRRAGLVITERQGRHVVYRLSERDAPVIAAIWRQLPLESDVVIGADAWRAGSPG